MLLDPGSQNVEMPFGLPFADILAWASAKPLGFTGKYIHITGATHHFAQSGCLITQQD
jgi:hypothetical protein